MVLVTGAAGTLGSEICRQLVGEGREVIALDIDEYGLWKLHNVLHLQTMCDSITRVAFWHSIKDMDIDTVINCAAVKHVWTSQQHAEWAREVNDYALYNMFGRRWKVVQVSTDKAVLPTCEYGLQKLNAERYALRNGGVAIRLVNIHWSRGCAEEIFKEQIARGGPVLARDPRMKRYFTTVEQAAKDVVEVSLFANAGLYMPDAGGPVLIDYIIKELIAVQYDYWINNPWNADQHKIGIEYTGIQDGEKLIEDLTTPYEKLIPVEWSTRIWEVVRG